MSVMRAISMVVDSLDDTTKLVNALKNLGENHGRHSIQESHFQVSFICILPVINTDVTVAIITTFINLSP